MLASACHPVPLPAALHLAALHGHLDVIRVLLAALQQHNLSLQQVQQQLESPPCSPGALRHVPAPLSPSAPVLSPSGKGSKTKASSPAAVTEQPAAAAAAGDGLVPVALFASETDDGRGADSTAAAAAAAAPEAAATSPEEDGSKGGAGGGVIVSIHGVDVRNHNGDTPLMFAASSGHLGATALLVNVSDGSVKGVKWWGRRTGEGGSSMQLIPCLLVRA